MIIKLTNKFTKCAALFEVDKKGFKDPRSFGKAIGVAVEGAAWSLGCEKDDLIVEHIKEEKKEHE